MGSITGQAVSLALSSSVSTLFFCLLGGCFVLLFSLDLLHRGLLDRCLLHRGLFHRGLLHRGLQLVDDGLPGGRQTLLQAARSVHYATRPLRRRCRHTSRQSLGLNTVDSPLERRRTRPTPKLGFEKFHVIQNLIGFVVWQVLQSTENTFLQQFIHAITSSLAYGHLDQFHDGISEIVAASDEDACNYHELS